MRKATETKKLNLRFLAVFTALQMILIVVFLSCGITIAFLTASQSVTNQFILAQPDIEIEEPNVSNPDGVDWGADNKNVRISVASDHASVYVKAALIISAKDHAGQLFPLNFGELSAPNAVTGELITGDFTLHFNTNWQDDWFYKNGYFYYKHILNSGEQTEILLKGITLTDDSETIKAKYQKLTVNVDVLSSSIQAKGSAVTEWGVSLESDGVTLTP